MLEGLVLTPKRVNKSARRAVRRLAPRKAAPEVGLTQRGGMSSPESAPPTWGAFSLAAKQIFFGAPRLWPLFLHMSAKKRRDRDSVTTITPRQAAPIRGQPGRGAKRLSAPSGTFVDPLRGQL